MMVVPYKIEVKKSPHKIEVNKMLQSLALGTTQNKYGIVAVP